MKLRLIRSATMRITYAGFTFVTDPYLAAKHTMPSYAGASPNPLVELPCSPEEAISGVDFAVLSHLHSDHFDPTGRGLLAKDLPIYCQPEDAAALDDEGFAQVIPVTAPVSCDALGIMRIPGQHGTGTVQKEMGAASGFVFSAPGEPTVYWIGDSIWCPPVALTLAAVQPDVVITHSGGAVWGKGVPIIMDAAQTVTVCQAAPQATIVAVHMEALDHQTVTRAALRAYAEAHGIPDDRLLIPDDGEVLTLV